MKKRQKSFIAVIIILTTLFSVQQVAAQEWNLTSYQALYLNTINQQINITQFSEFSRIAKVTLNTTLFPKETYRQKVLEQYLNVEANINGSNVVYTWRLPPGNLNFTVYSKLRTKAVHRQIDAKVKFPLEKIPKEVRSYLNATEHINLNNAKIRRLASELAEGEDDLFVVVFKIFNWVYSNINYSTKPDVANSVKNASWVLQNKRGACDELAALTISMLRVLHIPARYVAGQAFSNYQQEGWQNHAWVEVYFPGYGWLPLDVAYGEFGFVDSSHISFFSSEDVANTPSVLSYDVSDANISLSKPIINTTLLETSGDIKDEQEFYQLNIEPYKERVGIGSHNYLVVTLNNSNDYYVVAKIKLLGTKGLNYYNELEKFVLLKPNEFYREYFIVKTMENVSDRFVVTYPVKVVSLRGYEASCSFEMRKDFEYYNYDRISSIVKTLERTEKRENKNFSHSLKLKCTKLDNLTYVNETIHFSCKISNSGNVNLLNIKLCSRSSCIPIDLDIGQSKELYFNETLTMPGYADFIFSADARNVGVSDVITVKVLKYPKLEIAKLTYPVELGYKDKGQISMLINNTAGSQVSEVYVDIKHKFIQAVYPLPDFYTAKLVKLNFEGKDLDIGENEFNITIHYKDLKGRAYNTTATIDIQLTKLTFIQKIPIYLRKFFVWLDSLFR